MGYFFSAHEIAEMAMEIEEKGIDFYKKAAALAPDERTRKWFIFLANAEVDHKDMFWAIAEAEKTNGSLDEYSIDVARNLRALIQKFEGLVFAPKVPDPSSMNIWKCLDLGISVEEGLIEAYTELRGKCISKFHAVLEKIINEEKKHLEILRDIKARLAL